MSQIRDHEPDFPLPTESQGDGKKEGEMQASTGATGGCLPFSVKAARLPERDGFRGRLARRRADCGSVGRRWVREAVNGVVEPDLGPRSRFSFTHRNPRCWQKKRQGLQVLAQRGMPSVLSLKGGTSMPNRWAPSPVGAPARQLWICGSTLAEKRQQTAWLSQMRDCDPDFPLPTEPTVMALRG